MRVSICKIISENYRPLRMKDLFVLIIFRQNKRETCLQIEKPVNKKSHKIFCFLFSVIVPHRQRNT